jgi:hypothetical protein
MKARASLVVSKSPSFTPVSGSQGPVSAHQFKKLQNPGGPECGTRWPTNVVIYENLSQIDHDFCHTCVNFSLFLSVDIAYVANNSVTCVTLPKIFWVG